MPYLQAVSGFSYNVDMIRARMPNAPVDSLALIFDPKVVAHFADCGVSFLDSPEDTIGMALSYLHLNPNSTRPATCSRERLLKSVRPYVPA